MILVCSFIGLSSNVIHIESTAYLKAAANLYYIPGWSHLCDLGRVFLFLGCSKTGNGMSKERLTISEQIFIYFSEKKDPAIIRNRIAEGLYRIVYRLPEAASLLPLPDDLGDEYVKQIHLCQTANRREPMEIAIRMWDEDDHVTYEYSTDYEL